jgi:hypothetical protein
MEIKLLKIGVITLLLTVFISGCATERSITPTLSEAPRAGLELKPPILGAVFDGRASKSAEDIAQQLQSDLHQIYGASIQWDNYFARTPPGRITMRVRIVTLGSSFGSRLVSSTAFANAVGSAQGSATSSWGTVVGSISSQQSMFAGSFSGEGWWNGAAWIDLEIQDNRGTTPVSFTLPIVAEHRESNMWGYSSGDKAARIAWERVSVQLTRAIDAIVRAVRDQQI